MPISWAEEQVENSGTGMAQPVVHTPVMGLLLMSSEVGRPSYPEGKRVEFGVRYERGVKAMGS